MSEGKIIIETDDGYWIPSETFSGEVRGVTVDGVDYVPREEAYRFKQFAREAWKELKAIGRNDVFCYERFELMARDAGLE